MRYESAFRRLDAIADLSVLSDEPLASRTTFRIGGPAALLVTCEHADSVSAAVRVLEDERIAWTCLGGGSNLLVADEGYDGAVLKLGAGLAGASWSGPVLTVGAAVALAGVVRAASERGMRGLEPFSGIPGTVGGAIAMNAGSRDEWIGAHVRRVSLVSRDGSPLTLDGSEVEWGYRRSGLTEIGVIIGAELEFEQGDADESRRLMSEALGRRKATQPLGFPNAGSVFVNPPGDSSGRLIEACGLKGTCVGGACVSDVHANFIVNSGGATARDVLALVALIREKVEREADVTLEPEIRFLGAIQTT